MCRERVFWTFMSLLFSLWLCGLDQGEFSVPAPHPVNRHCSLFISEILSLVYTVIGRVWTKNMWENSSRIISSWSSSVVSRTTESTVTWLEAGARSKVKTLEVRNNNVFFLTVSFYRLLSNDFFILGWENASHVIDVCVKTWNSYIWAIQFCNYEFWMTTVCAATSGLSENRAPNVLNQDSCSQTGSEGLQHLVHAHLMQQVSEPTLT